jgi:hypothetical protein
LILFAAAALVSLAVGVGEGVHRGTDFQWSGARLVAEHQDPWKTFLSGDPKHQIILGQQPNYLPELFVLFLPLGLMPFSKAVIVWAVINVTLAILSARLVARIFNLDSRQSLTCSLLFLACTPLRVTIANGQQGILVLFFLTASVYCTTVAWQGIWLGLSYCKYSFAPVMVLSWLFDRRYVAILTSAIPPLLGMAIVYFLIGSSLLDITLGPLRVSQIAFSGTPGYADLMTISHLVFNRIGSHAGEWSRSPELLALAASIPAVAYMHKYGCVEPTRSAVAITLTLLIFKHVSYDFGVLLLPFAAAIRASKSLARAAAICIILYFWFGVSFVNRLFHWPSIPILIFNAVALSVLAYVILTKCSPDEAPNREADAQ